MHRRIQKIPWLRMAMLLEATFYISSPVVWRCFQAKSCPISTQASLDCYWTLCHLQIQRRTMFHLFKKFLWAHLGSPRVWFSIYRYKILSIVIQRDLIFITLKVITPKYSLKSKAFVVIIQASAQAVEVIRYSKLPPVEWNASKKYHYALWGIKVGTIPQLCECWNQAFVKHIYKPRPIYFLLWKTSQGLCSSCLPQLILATCYFSRLLGSQSWQGLIEL